jgi:shikimate kinase
VNSRGPRPRARRKALALIGFMGSGKSVVGALVAQRAAAPFQDLDQMIEDEVGMPISDFFAIHGEDAFRAVESRVLPEALQPGAVVALGGGAQIDDTNWRLIRERSITVFIDCLFETIWRRTRGATNRPLAVGRSRDELESMLEQRRPRYREALHIVSGDKPAELVAEEIVKLWSA